MYDFDLRGAVLGACLIALLIGVGIGLALTLIPLKYVYYIITFFVGGIVGFLIKEWLN